MNTIFVKNALNVTKIYHNSNLEWGGVSRPYYYFNTSKRKTTSFKVYVSQFCWTLVKSNGKFNMKFFWKLFNLHSTMLLILNEYANEKSEHKNMSWKGITLYRWYYWRFSMSADALLDLSASIFYAEIWFFKDLVLEFFAYNKKE